MAWTVSERVDSPFRPQGTGEAWVETAAGTITETVPAPELPLREMTGFEEEYVECHLDETNTARVANEVLARCLVAPGTDHGVALERVRSLLVVDRDVALVRLRRLSIGDTVDSEVDCPGCGIGNRVRFDLSSLPIEIARPPAPLVVSLADGRTAVLRLPTSGDQEALLDAGVGGRAERVTWLIARLMQRYGEQEGPFDAVAARALPTGVRAAIEAALAASVPELDLTMQLQCSGCGLAFVAPFDVAGFFLPR